MRRPSGRFAGLLGAGLVALACGVAAQAPDGPAERVGQRLDDALREVRERFRDVSEDVRGGIARTRASVQAMGVEARAYSRLHWDKTLHDERIVVHVNKQGLAILRGTVTDARAKTKAVALTRDTLGVTSVNDQLEVRAEPSADRP